MTTFTVWKYDDAGRADEAERILRDAAHEGLVEIHDTAVVSWPQGDARPTTHHGHEDTKKGTGWGALWGFVFGLLFFMPLIGAAAGAAIGAASKSLNGLGIKESDLDTLRAQITQGTSALFAVTEGADLDRLGERVHGLGGSLILTNLTDAEKKNLLEVVD
ncbi:DUF1269 domain-containing protein [Luteimicrobium xylanilyticum]|uniref:DUF1269 domain-containing protein n=1 Tax=Luteimicrobium xylanilyticum TaxID=1133546 RepID=A0A5P9Q627_9MICO|nr:DUF1269 domain-containing protein [Luteimicrobium xylanilyticum]QFU96819.1 hypothetical protein KDY119_00309 [Luteimicrobium xylanilyticum]